jgi:hypothetical protein
MHSHTRKITRIELSNCRGRHNRCALEHPLEETNDKENQKNTRNSDGNLEDCKVKHRGAHYRDEHEDKNGEETRGLSYRPTEMLRTRQTASSGCMGPKEKTPTTGHRKPSIDLKDLTARSKALRPQ